MKVEKVVYKEKKMRKVRERKKGRGEQILPIYLSGEFSQKLLAEGASMGIHRVPRPSIPTKRSPDDSTGVSSVPDYT